MGCELVMELGKRISRQLRMRMRNGAWHEEKEQRSLTFVRPPMCLLGSTQPSTHEAGRPQPYGFQI